MIDPKWKTDMVKVLSSKFYDPEEITETVEPIVIRELDEAKARETTLRKLAELQSARLVQLVGECQRLAKLALPKDEAEKYRPPFLDESESYVSHLEKVAIGAISQLVERQLSDPDVLAVAEFAEFNANPELEDSEAHIAKRLLAVSWLGGSDDSG